MSRTACVQNLLKLCRFFLKLDHFNLIPKEIITCIIILKVGDLGGTSEKHKMSQTGGGRFHWRESPGCVSFDKVPLFVI